MNKIYIVMVGLSMITCTPAKEQTEVYSIFFDTTDPLLAVPQIDEVLKIIDLENAEKTILFRYKEISDVDFNVVSQLKRSQQQTGLFANAVQEKKKRRQFETKIRTLIQEKDTTRIGASHSSIFQPIVAELNYAASLDRQYIKHLIVYSDLMENSDWMSFYRTHDLLLLERNSDKIVQRYLEQTNGLTGISNLRMHIVFIPKNARENTRYKKIQAVYIKVFNQMGIPISFSANLTKADYGK